MKNIFLKLSIAITALLPAFFSVSAQAQQEASDAKQPRKQTLSFEDELVQGSTQKPELFFLFQKKNFNYKRLIRLRENFLPEMRRSTEDIHRPRSGSE